MIGSPNVQPECHDDRARERGEADEAVAASVVADGDQRGAVELASCAQTDLRGGLVADEPDDARAASATRWSMCCGLMRRLTASIAATQALMKIAATRSTRGAFRP
jgi:hypothetical protein